MQTILPSFIFKITKRFAMQLFELGLFLDSIALLAMDFLPLHNGRVC